MLVDMHAHANRTPAVRRLLAAECRRNGVQAVLISALGAAAGWPRYPAPAAVRAANASARALADGSRGRVRWMVYLNPQNRNWPVELERGRRAGACGIKLWVALKDGRGRLDRTLDVLRAAARLGLPVLLHTYNRTDPLLPGEIDMAEFAGLSRRVPAAKLIAAHAGANWRQSLAILRGLRPGTFVDLSGGFPERGMTEALVAAIGADRVLFGSDATGRSIASQRAKVDLAALPDADKDRIRWRNAAVLFRLGPLPPAPPAPARRPPANLDLARDHFCFCGRWPLFESPCPTPASLGRLLERHEVREALTADLECLFALDLDAANRRFRQAAAGVPRVRPLAVINPRAHDWRNTLATARAGFAGVLLAPALHRWRLADPAAAAVLRHCAAGRLPVWINAALGDRRLRHSALEPLALTRPDLLWFLRTAPANAYVFQGLDPSLVQAALTPTRRRRDVRFEISRLTDRAGCLAAVLARYGGAPFVLGSEFPLRDLRTVRWTAAVCA